MKKLGTAPKWASRLIRLIESKIERPAPYVAWLWSSYGSSEDDHIVMPSVEWMTHYQQSELAHKVLLLHELAHWYSGNEGHTRRMYALFFWFCRWARLPMRQVVEMELEYKPRASRSGYRLYRRQLRTYQLPVPMAA